MWRCGAACVFGEVKEKKHAIAFHPSPSLSLTSIMSRVVISSSTTVSFRYTHSASYPGAAPAGTPIAAAGGPDGARPQKNCWAAAISMSLCRLVKGRNRPRTASTFFLRRASWGTRSVPEGSNRAASHNSCCTRRRAATRLSVFVYSGPSKSIKSTSMRARDRSDRRSPMMADVSSPRVKTA